MSYHKISSDIKLAAIYLYLDCMGFHEHTFYCIFALWLETGNVVKHNFGAPEQSQILHFDCMGFHEHILPYTCKEYIPIWPNHMSSKSYYNTEHYLLFEFI
jgi:hypothetical protein